MAGAVAGFMSGEAGAESGLVNSTAAADEDLANDGAAEAATLANTGAGAYTVWVSTVAAAATSATNDLADAGLAWAQTLNGAATAFFHSAIAAGKALADTAITEGTALANDIAGLITGFAHSYIAEAVSVSQDIANDGRNAGKAADSAVTTLASGIVAENHDIAIDGLNAGRDAAIDSSTIDDPLLIAMANVDRYAEIYAAAQAYKAQQLALPIEFESLVPGGATPTSSLPTAPLPNTLDRLADDPGQSWVVYLYDAQPLSGVGHAAVLIGSEGKGWRYFSFSTGASGWSWAGDLGNLEVRGYQSIARCAGISNPIPASDIIAIVHIRLVCRLEDRPNRSGSRTHSGNDFPRSQLSNSWTELRRSRSVYDSGSRCHKS